MVLTTLPMATHRELLEVAEGLRGPTGKWILTLIREQAASAAKNACQLVPDSISALVEREHLISQSNTLTSLADSLPGVIQTQVKEAQDKELAEQNQK